MSAERGSAMQRGARAGRNALQDFWSERTMLSRSAILA